MKLLIERVENVEFKEEEILVEGASPEKQLFVEGIFLQGEIKNRNGRSYPMNILRKEVGRYTTESIERRNAYGELGHPNGPIINPERISHRIVSLKEDGKNFIGKAKVIVDNPMGAIARNLIKEGSLAVSSRGVGSVRKVGNASEVQEDFYLSTAADFVINPSAPDAFVDGIMEGMEWIWTNGVLTSRELESLQDDINESVRHKTLNEQALLKTWDKFMNFAAKSK